MANGERGALAARSFLVNNHKHVERRDDNSLPYMAIVTDVDGARVRLRSRGAATAGLQWVPYLSATVSVGDHGVVFPLRGGGEVFAKLEPSL